MGYNIISFMYTMLAIISFVAADSITPEEVERNMMQGLHGLLCPPIGKKEKFELSTVQTQTKMYGCAYLGFDKLSSSGPLFHLWVENPQLVVNTSVKLHGNCHNTHQMDHFMFECLTKGKQINKAASQQGWQYTSLREYTVNDNGNAIPTKSYRCALYDVEDDANLHARIIRMVISKPEIGEEFHKSQCEGLSAFLSRNDLPLLPKGLRHWPDGSLFLHLIGRSSNFFYTTKSVPTNNPKVKNYPVSQTTTITTETAATISTEKSHHKVDIYRIRGRGH